MLHVETDRSRAGLALGMAHAVEPVERLFGRRLRGGPGGAVRGAGLGRPVRGRAPEDDNVEKRVRAKPVGAVDRHAGRLAYRHEPRHRRRIIAVLRRDDLAVMVGRDAAHVVMHRRQHRNRLAGHVDTAENACRLGDPRQPLMQRVGIDMLKMEHDVVLVRADTASFIDFDGHRTADDVPAGKVLRRRREPLHEALAFGIGQISAFTARALGDQDTGAIDTRRVELHELHVLKRQPGAKHHRIAVAGTCVGRGAGEIDPPVTASGKHRLLAPEPMQRAVFHAQRNYAGALVVLVHQKVEGKEFDVEMRLMLQALLVQRVKDGMAGPVGGGAGAAGHRLSVIKRVATERALVDLAFFGARERNAVILEFDHRRDGVAAHIFDRVLVAEPVGTLDRVIHVVLPVVALAHVVQRGADAALRGNGVRAGRKDLRDAGRFQAGCRHAERGPQAGAAGAYDDDIIIVIGDFISRHQVNPFHPFARMAPS